MRLLLINRNPAVSRLIKLSAQKAEYELEEFESFDFVPSATYDIILVDNEVYDKDALLKFKELSICDYVVYICQRGSAKPEEADSILDKPFLPTDFLSELEKIKAIISAREDKLAADRCDDLAQSSASGGFDIDDIDNLDNDEEEPFSMAFLDETSHEESLDISDAKELDFENLDQEEESSFKEAGFKEEVTKEEEFSFEDASLEDEVAKDDEFAFEDLEADESDKTDEIVFKEPEANIGIQEEDDSQDNSLEEEIEDMDDFAFEEAESKEEEQEENSLKLDELEDLEVEDELDKLDLLENTDDSFDEEDEFEESEEELLLGEEEETVVPSVLDKDDINEVKQLLEDSEEDMFELDEDDMGLALSSEQDNNEIKADDFALADELQEDIIDDFAKSINEENIAEQEEEFPPCVEVDIEGLKKAIECIDSLDDLNENMLKKALGEEIEEDEVCQEVCKDEPLEEKKQEFEVIKEEIESSISRSISGLAKSDILRDALKGMRINISITFDEKE